MYSIHKGKMPPNTSYPYIDMLIQGIFMYIIASFVVFMKNREGNDNGKHVFLK